MFRFLSLLNVLLLLGCGGKNGPMVPVAPQGTVSGGGGYSDTNGSSLLKRLSEDLAGSISKASRSVLGQLPSGWDQNKVIATVRGIHQSPNEHRFRDGHELMFDYNAQANPPYIEALSPFYVTYGKITPESRISEEVRSDLYLRFLHEVSHLWGYSEEQA